METIIGMGLYLGILFGQSPHRIDYMSPRKRIRKLDYLLTAEVASVLGVSQRTLLRRLAAGIWPEPMRDPENNYRMWRPVEVQHLREVLERKIQ